MERYLTRKHTAVRQAAQDGRAVDTPVTDEPPADAAPPLPSREQPERRAHRLARYEEVVALRACGASVRTIAARVGIGQRTVQRWLRAGRFPERRQRSERWAQGGHNATQLWQELCARGYTGCYGSVAALVAPWRGACYRHRGQVTERRPAAAGACAYTPRQVCWLLLKAPADLTADEQASLTRLYHACPQVAVAEALVEEFGAVLRERDVEGLYTWLRGAAASGIKDLQGVARSL